MSSPEVRILEHPAGQPAQDQRHADREAVSELRVARIMKENNASSLLRKRRKPVATGGNYKLKPSPNPLEQKFHSQTPNAVWLAEMTSRIQLAIATLPTV
jgi:transposase InsO family protein